MQDIPREVWTKIDARLRARNEFTYDAITEELEEHYRVGDDVPDLDDGEGELHYWISAFHAHYVELGLAEEGR